jgi:hypothetical protein
MSELETMLRASVELVELRQEVATLKAENAAKDKRIAALEGQLRRSTPRFQLEATIPALLRPQAG